MPGKENMPVSTRRKILTGRFTVTRRRQLTELLGDYRMNGNATLEKETRWNIVRCSTTGQSDIITVNITCTEVAP